MKTPFSGERKMAFKEFLMFGMKKSGALFSPVILAVHLARRLTAAPNPRCFFCIKRALVFVILCATPIASAAARPNILLIMSDDMGFSDLGCYGGEIRTPHLDALARGGVRFTQFYNMGRCCPTRASLLTGLYPHQAGVGHMIVVTMVIAETSITIARRSPRF